MTLGKYCSLAFYFSFKILKPEKMHSYYPHMQTQTHTPPHIHTVLILFRVWYIVQLPHSVRGLTHIQCVFFCASSQWPKSWLKVFVCRAAMTQEMKKKTPQNNQFPYISQTSAGCAKAVDILAVTRPDQGNFMRIRYIVFLNFLFHYGL